jgi:glycosyltransferase involved in cell wall biosynthesis
MKILMLSSTFPYPPTRGGTQVRTFNFLKYLSDRHEITLVTQQGEEVSEADLEGLRKWVTQLVVFPRPSQAKGGRLQKLQRLRQFLSQGTPPNVLSSYSQDMQRWIDHAVAERRFEVIACEHSVNEIYVRPDWRQQIRTVVNIHSSVYRTCKHQLQTNTSENARRDRLYLPLLKRYEQRFCQKFTQIVVTTEEDRQQIAAFNPPSQITVIPNGVDLALFPYRQADPGGHHLILTGGMDYVVNIDAACFFSQAVLPILQQKYPDTTLTIVGANPAPAVLALAKHPGIAVTGRVPFMADYLHRATVCVVPMRSGFGIKNKTLEAMAAGTPVVGSDRGLEGIEVDRPLCALRANRVEEYVSAIARLFEEAPLREQLAGNARAMLEKDYTWERMGKRYEQVVTSNSR